MCLFFLNLLKYYQKTKKINLKLNNLKKTKIKNDFYFYSMISNQFNHNFSFQIYIFTYFIFIIIYRKPILFLNDRNCT